MPRGRRNRTPEPIPVGASGAMAARRRLGRILAELREQADVTVERASAHIERGRQTLWKIEDGQPGVRIRPDGDIRRLCDLYGADEKTCKGLQALVEATKVKGWFQLYSLSLPSEFNVFLGLEESAIGIDTYEQMVVPGLLQTEGYARALLSVPFNETPRSEEEIEERVVLRMRRQEVLYKQNPLRLDCLIYEAALREPVGDAAQMAGQLRHLCEIGELSNVTVRILPFGGSDLRSLMVGPFHMMYFADDSPCVFAEAYMGDLWFKEPKETARYELALRGIQASAMDATRSRNRIAQAAKEYSRA